MVTSYTTVYSFYAEDDCGNSTTATYTLTVVDTTAPVILGAPDATVECGEPFDLVTYAAEDNCSAFEVEIDSVFTAACGNTGNWVITYTATDACGNSTVATQNITIIDTTAPLLEVAPSAQVECGEDFDLVAYGAADVCGSVSVDVDSAFTAACGNTGNWVITYTATDECGNSTVATQDITIIDTTAPSITANPDATVECGMDFDLGGSSASDICGMVTIDVDSIFDGACGNTGVWVLTYTATDECGNSATDQQIITIEDTTDPVFVNPPANTTAECDDVPAPLDIEVSDNCGSVDVDYDEILFSGGCEGTLERTWIITDECGNSNIHIQYINLIDTTAPIR